MNSSVRNALPTCDAILISEDQDYRPIWWDALREVVTPEGEKLLAAKKRRNYAKLSMRE